MTTPATTTSDRPTPVTGRRTIHPALALAMIAAPVIKVVAGAISPALKSSASAQLSVIAASPTRWYWYSLLMVIGSVVAIPAAIGLLQLAAVRMRRVGAIGGALVTLGFLGSIVDTANQLWAWQMVSPAADRHQMAALLDRFNNAAGTNLIFAATGIALLVGTVLVTIALVHGQCMPSWAAVSFGAAVLVNIVSFANNSVPGVAASFVLLLLGLGSIGAMSLRASRSAAKPAQSTEPALV